jgi:hypothetical protein
MENQCFDLEGDAVPVNVECGEIKEVFELQLAVIGGGCVEYCPY